MNFEETMQSNPPRLVVQFQLGKDGSENFQWGIVGQIPMLSLIGGISAVQSCLTDNRWMPECTGEQPALVITWDAEHREMSCFLHNDIPTLPLSGMLEVIKSMLTASRTAQHMGASRVESSVLGLDGRPMRLN